MTNYLIKVKGINAEGLWEMSSCIGEGKSTLQAIAFGVNYFTALGFTEIFSITCEESK